MKIIKLDFNKTDNKIDSADYGHVDLTDKKNLQNIRKYILPIISRNEGWDTADVYPEGFEIDPSQFQESFDASLFANVHVAIDDDGTSLGLIEFLEETLTAPLSVVRMENLRKMIASKDSWDELLELKVLDEPILNKHFEYLESYFKNRFIYSEIGITVRPDLQGKRSGVSENLYKVFKKGIIFGWTSSPLLLAQWRKNFTNVLYFPLFGEKYSSLEFVASLAILYADLLTYDKERWLNYEFGALNSTYFVTKRSRFYSDLTNTLLSQNKITKFDKKRIDYCLERDSIQGAIFAFN